jgi:hypothetical protein
VQYPPPIVAQNEQDKENPEGRSWNCEEIQRNGVFGMICLKRWNDPAIGSPVFYYRHPLYGV